jgi:hypothetical protein
MAKASGLWINAWLLAATLSTVVTMRTGSAEAASPHDLARAHHPGATSFAAGVAGRIHAHHPLRASQPPVPVERNTIGVPIAPRNVIQESGVGRSGFQAPPNFPAAAASGTGSIAHQGLVEPGVARWNSSPIRSSVNRGAIDGSGLIRPSSATSALGGPAKWVAGINGSTIRPKH